jgi:hypothetical protein
VDDHLRKARFCCGLVPLENAQWSRTTTCGFHEDDLFDLAREVELKLPLRTPGIEG